MKPDAANAMSVYRDWDMRPPMVVLHYGPVLLGLFCLMLSLSGYSVFIGFEEHQPATWLSLILIFFVCLLLLAVLKNHERSSSERRMAGICLGLAGVALLDEKLQWHEAVGEFVQDEIAAAPESWAHYCDDLIILTAAVFGSYLLYRIIQFTAARREVGYYLAALMVPAIGHALLDILGHGDQFLLLIYPQAVVGQLDPFVEVLSYFEEILKLWTEWFVILFILKLFYRQNGLLLWSIQVFVGSLLAVLGLWGVADPSAGIPYRVLGHTLKFIRNPQHLFVLSTIWFIWAGLVWRYFATQNFRHTIAGSFFLCPYPLLLTRMTTEPLLAWPQLSPSTLLLPGLSLLILAAGLGLLLFRTSRPLYGQAVIAIAIVIFTVNGPSAGPLFPAVIGGGIMPVVLFLFFTLRPRRAIYLMIAVSISLLFPNPAITLIIFGALLMWGLKQLSLRRLLIQNRWWQAFCILHMVVVFTAVVIAMPAMMPNRRYTPPEKVMFQSGRQPYLPEHVKLLPQVMNRNEKTR